MSTMNSIMLDLLYEDELWHEEPGYSKAEKAKYNREYYRKHKQYWKDYYKTGRGIGRGLSAKPTESASNGRRSVSEAARMLDAATKDKYTPQKRRSVSEAARMLDAATKDKYAPQKRRSVSEAARMLDAATKDKQSEYEKKLRKAALERAKKTVGTANKVTSLDVDKINRDSDIQNRAKQVKEATTYLDSKTKDRAENTRKKVAGAGYNYLKKTAKENAKEFKRTGQTLERDAAVAEKAINKIKEANRQLDAMDQENADAVKKAAKKYAKNFVDENVKEWNRTTNNLERDAAVAEWVLNYLSNKRKAFIDNWKAGIG